MNLPAPVMKPKGTFRLDVIQKCGSEAGTKVLLLRGHRNRKSPTERRDDQRQTVLGVTHSERCGRDLLGLLFEGGSLRECPSDHKERVLTRREKEGR